MKVKIVFIILCVFFVFSSSIKENKFVICNKKKPGQSSLLKQYVDNQIVVKMSTGKFEEDIIDMLFFPKFIFNNKERFLFSRYSSEIRDIKFHEITEHYVIETYKNCDPEKFLERLHKDPLIEDASLNYIATIFSVTPNDGFFNYQYALLNTGQIYLSKNGLSGTKGSDIKAVEGWEWTTGSEDMVIAVLDTGVASDHEDLQNRVVPGYNIVGDNFNTYDDHGHGTFVASIIAAETNNSKGMAGVCWKGKIMPIKVMDSEGSGNYLAIAVGIKTAVDNGAKIINLSIGGKFDSFIIKDACRYAFERNCVIVAAAGNSELLNPGNNVSYPAAYDEYCLAVGATNAYDNITPWSNFGPQIDVVAPGEYIFGAHFDPAKPGELHVYGYRSGTSFATPIVSGAAALLISYKPFLSNSQVMDLIKYTADDVNSSVLPGIDDYMGYGRINLRALLGTYNLN